MKNKIYIFLGLLVVLIVSTFFLAYRNGGSESSETEMNESIKSFSIRSYTDMIDGLPKPTFNPKNLEVNFGDTVVIEITTESGRHDFKIDEFDVHVSTPTGETTRVEFVANQSGDFVYYCTMPGHRENGHWGTLTVKE